MFHNECHIVYFPLGESETESCTFCLTVFSEAHTVSYSLDVKKEKEKIAVDRVLRGLCATYAVIQGCAWDMLCEILEHALLDVQTSVCM